MAIVTITGAEARSGSDMSFDAFGRLRVSEPVPLFDQMAEYGNIAAYWDSALVGTGAISNVANNCAVRLSTGGTASAAQAVRATRQYMRYQPGRSLNIETTFAMSAEQTAATARIGYYDTGNGIFLERYGSSVSIVRRTKVTGSAVDNAVPQSSWNFDPLNGTGPSGKTLDVTKTQILFIQLQFLGVGRVQVGFVIDGDLIVAHEFLNANVLSTVYMSTGCLPVRAEVVNTGTASGIVTMDMFCTSVSSGGIGAEHLEWYRGSPVAGKATSTTLVPIMSVRAATLLGGTSGGGSITNRGQIIPLTFTFVGQSASHEIQIVRNGTLTGSSFSANATNSIADFDTAATAISGGDVLSGQFLGSGSGATTIGGSSAYTGNPIVYSSLANTQDIITVCARTLSGAGTVNAGINWREEF